ncbi:hypothetical protein [Actinomadura sp. 9N215]|uniref:hypothetical protein n=1 Tax=Actinomadura sp. 9N215 TaxID=3375150 RepID=UPI0037996517
MRRVLQSLIVAGAVVSSGLVVATPAGAAADRTTTTTAVTTTAAETATPAVAAARWSRKETVSTGYHPQCRGWTRYIAPYKTGRYIKTYRQLHCNRGGWGRKMSIKTTLQQYRGLGYWRTKASKSAKDNSNTPAWTIKQGPKWKCSGGSQLYRGQTKLHVWSVLRGSQTSTMNSSKKRIRC